MMKKSKDYLMYNPTIKKVLFTFTFLDVKGLRFFNGRSNNPIENG